MRGQMFTMDMALSMMVFLGVVGIAISMINHTADAGTIFTEEDLMKDKLMRTADLMVRTQGFPEEWNRSTVRIVGISEPSHTVQPERFVELKRTEYNRFKSINRIVRYDFYIDIVVDGNLTGMGGICGGSIGVVASEEDNVIDAVSESGYDWDLYWSGGSSVPYTGFENVYNGSRDEVFESVVSNSSSYSCIVAVEPNVSASDIGNSGRLEGFVDNNVYVQFGEGKIIEVVGVSSQDFSGNGTVLKNPDILNMELSKGDEVGFESPAYGFGSYDKGYVGSGGLCAVCSWNSSVYYFTDSVLKPFPGRGNSFDPYFFGTNSTFGKIYEKGSDVVPLRRQVMINKTGGNIRARTRMVLWK